jgi:hypothetical protein
MLPRSAQDDKVLGTALALRSSQTMAVYFPPDPTISTAGSVVSMAARESSLITDYFLNGTLQGVIAKP